jgi:hypothetical protein
MGDLGPPEHGGAFLAIALEPRQLEAGQDVRLLAHLEQPPWVVARWHRDEAERDEDEANDDGEGRRREEPCEEVGHVRPQRAVRLVVKLKAGGAAPYPRL